MSNSGAPPSPLPIELTDEEQRQKTQETERELRNQERKAEPGGD